MKESSGAMLAQSYATCQIRVKRVDAELGEVE